MKLDDILNEKVERGERVAFNFNNSLLDMTDEMVFNLEDLIIMTEHDYAEIGDAGQIKLNITPEQLAQKVVDSSPQMVVEIEDVSFDAQHLKNFQCTTDCSKPVPNLPANFELEITYRTSDGESKSTTVPFRGVAFRPSQEFVQKYRDLTRTLDSDNMSTS
jgi:hypothetical protein